MFKKKKPSRSFGQKSKNNPPVSHLRAVKEVSSGGLVFKRVPRGVQFAVMLDSYGKWAFPKGHVELGESLPEAAARETLEELGLNQVRLLEYLGKIDIWFRDRFEKHGALVHKDIHYFLFEALADADLHPDPAERAYEAMWVSSKQLFKASSYPDMAPIIKRALALVEKGV